MSALDRAAGAATLKRLRHDRGWSLAHVARAIIDQAARLGQPLDAGVASVQRSIARWECKCPILPCERYQLLLAHLYARTPSGQLQLGTGSDFAELLDALALMGESQNRLDELCSLIVRTTSDHGANLLALLGPPAQRVLSAALADPGQADEQLLAAVGDAVADVNKQVGSLPFGRLQIVLAPVVESCRRLLDADVPVPLQPGLQALAAQAYTLAGRIAFETRDDQASAAYYADATTAAERTGQPWRRAVVHMSHALVAQYSAQDITAAQILVDAAVRDARAGESVTVRARAHALQAEVEARAGARHDDGVSRAGAERRARAALSLAWYDLDGERDGDPATSSFSPAHLRGFEGVTALYVGDAGQAHDYFVRSVRELRAPRERVQRAIVATDQALARIRLNAPESAAELLHGCIDAAKETGGRVPAIRLSRARRDLRPWRREDWFTDLDDHLIESLGA